MRVAIDTTYARRAPYSGTAVYLERIVAALARLPDIEVVTIANERRQPPGGGGAASLANGLADLRWGAFELPRRAHEVRADVIHHPLPAWGYAPWAGAIAQVITVHDLAFERRPERFAPAYRRWAHQAHRWAARRAEAVICVSETTAADVRELWGVAPQRIVVARHGPGQEPALAERCASPTHILYVGDEEPRKDLPTLLAAHRRYAQSVAAPLPLVLAGSASASQPHVVAEPHPTPARLAELLAGAAALVHPAVYEGFGMTLLEAMRAGTPVIAAAAPGTVETCAGAARYVAPGDAPALGDAIAVLAASPRLQAQLADLGTARAATFSWELAARAHRDAYSLAVR